MQYSLNIKITSVKLFQVHLCFNKLDGPAERNIPPLESVTKKRKIDLTIEIPQPFFPTIDISRLTFSPPPPIDVMPNSFINPNTFIEINEAISMEDFWEELENKGGSSSNNASTNFDPSIEFKFDGIDDDFDHGNVFRFEGRDDDFNPFISFSFDEMGNDLEYEINDQGELEIIFSS